MQRSRGFTPSRYQTAIYDFIDDGKGHAVVNAVAGSGKTTTIVNGLTRISSRERVLFVAFNKHIVNELKERTPGHVDVVTLNSLGWRSCMANVRGKIQLEGGKTEYVMRDDVLPRMDRQGKAGKKFITPITKLVGLLKAHLVTSVEQARMEWVSLADKFAVELPDENADLFEALLMEAYRICIDQTHRMDFDDQIFMPIHHDYSLPSYDWVFVDEAQDLSPVQIELVKRVGGKGRIIAVGDSRQAIYGFRGADPFAIENIIRALNAAQLPLSICYRCAASIVRAAQEIVPHIEVAPTAPEGRIVNMTLGKYRDGAWLNNDRTTGQWLPSKDCVTDKDIVLCRTTAPLVRECMALIREGRKAIVKGRDIGDGLIKFIDHMAGSALPTLEEFFTRLDDYRAKEVSRLYSRNRPNEAMAVEDRCDTLEALAAGCTELEQLRINVNRIFDERTDGVMFMTVHKAKGLEAERVYIIRPDLMPHPMAQKDWQKTQEMNLKYVAITRAQKELIWVVGQHEGDASSAFSKDNRNHPIEKGQQSEKKTKSRKTVKV